MDIKAEMSAWECHRRSSIASSQLPGRDAADARQADETDRLISPLHFRLISVFFLFFEHFWRKLCIWQSEILCWVTYSVQFKVPLFLLHSAGIGSHRGAVQPLHCRGSDCRGRQRERERFDICILQPRPHQTDPRVRRRHPSTRSSSTCHHKQKKLKNPNTSSHKQRYYSSGRPLRGRSRVSRTQRTFFKFWVDLTPATRFECVVDVTDRVEGGRRSTERRDRGTQEGCFSGASC